MNAETATYVVVGTGPAGTLCACKLRALAPRARVVAVSRECGDAALPYVRKHLTHLLLPGHSEEELFYLGKDVFRKNNIEVVEGEVTGVHPEENCISFCDGRSISYTSLLIATGSTPQPLRCPGSDAEGVQSFFSLADARKLRDALPHVRRLVIVGAGRIALKLITRMSCYPDKSVTVVTRTIPPRSLCDEEVSSLLMRRLQAIPNVTFVQGEVAEVVSDGGHVTGVRLEGGDVVPCDVVVATIGVAPSIGCLQRSSLLLDRGLIVSETLQTSVHNIFAAGDVAQVTRPGSERSTLYQAWAHAKMQGKAAANLMLTACAKGNYEPCEVCHSLKAKDVTVLTIGEHDVCPLAQDISVRIVSSPDDPRCLYRKIVLCGGGGGCWMLAGAVFVFSPQVLSRHLVMAWLEASVGHPLANDPALLCSPDFAFVAVPHRV
eukprot:TRINITY_DN3720_c0_g1_i10.p1 TRINITY_DN3720_c0_g1~~TRINITY_DN3720_c0_g1_i10.p1  ORF type:complete len:434 (+),score=99.18 TRINITY_DN3720_c0_g1_i10:619-1920(+)